MELGFELGDDSLFEVSQVDTPRKSDAPVCYHVKNCPPRWFTDPIIELSPEDLAILKYSADLAYLEGRISEALHLYNAAQPALSSSNRSSWRSIEEDKARCYVHLQRFEEALCCAKNIAELTQNFDHTVSVLNLYIDIYQAAGRVNEETVCLRQMILLSPFNPVHWLRLGNLFYSQSPCCCQILDTNNDCLSYGVSRLNIQQSDVSDVCSNGEQRQAAGADKMNLLEESNVNSVQTQCVKRRIIVSLCYCATRSLLSRSQPLVQSFALEQNQKLLLQVQEKMKELNVDESLEQRCTSYLRSALAGSSEDVDADNTSQVIRVLKEQEEALRTFNSRYLSFI